MSTEKTKALELAIGQKVAELLSLKMDKKTGRCTTTWGTKTLQGLGACITRIVEEETEKLNLKPYKTQDDLIRLIGKLATDNTDIFPMVDSQYYDEEEIEEGSVADLSTLIMGHQKIDEIRTDGVDTENHFYPWDELYFEDLEYIYNDILLPLSKAKQTNEKE